MRVWSSLEGKMSGSKKTWIAAGFLVAVAAAIPAPAQAATPFKKANLTWFESYPAPDSEECREFNGCTWAGQFAFVSGKQPLSWVKSHNIVAVHQKDGSKYRLKTLRLKKGGKQLDVKVYDICADSDCDGCCTQNANKNGYKFLIDIEKYTKAKFGGQGSGTVEFSCLDCN